MICNRGEIARRVIRTANQHGLETVAIYTHVSTATDKLCFVNLVQGQAVQGPGLLLYTGDAVTRVSHLASPAPASTGTRCLTCLQSVHWWCCPCIDAPPAPSSCKL
jgi:hypothetical protein